MNPLDWRGGEFLVFYGILMTAVLLAARAILHAREGGPVPRLTAVDPYLIAYLRGRAPEAIRTATLALVDRGLLVANGTTVVAARAAAAVQRPIERAILDVCHSAREVTELFAIPRVIEACVPLEAELRSQRLLPDIHQVWRRLLLAALVLLMLEGTAISKIAVALGRGRHNIAFLIVLALVAAVITVVIFTRRRTSLGDRVIEDLQELFRELRARSADLPRGGATNEIALLLGVFGMTALAGDEYARAAALFPRAASTTGAGSSSCGSSCGSSSSCGGGGGCGGGGCGGCGG